MYPRHHLHSENPTPPTSHPPLPFDSEKFPLRPDVPSISLRALLQDIEQWPSPAPTTVPYAALQALAEYILTYQDTEPGIASAVVDLLHPSRIPSTGYHLAHDNVQAAIGAIEVISSQVQVIVTLGAPRQDIAQLFSENFLHCLEWLRSFCDKGIHIIPSAAFIITMLEMDVDVRKMVMGSPMLIELVLNMWMQQDEKGQYFLPMNGEERCPLLCLFSRITKDPVGRVTLCDHLQEYPTELESIADTMERRICATRRLLFNNAMSSRFAIRHLRGLASIVEQLLFKPERSLERFRSHKLLYHIPRALNAALLSEMSASIWIEVPELLGYLYTLTLKSDPSLDSPLEKVIMLIRGGIIRVLIKTLLHVPSSSEGHSSAEDFLRDIAGYVAYREVAPWLIDMVKIETVVTLPGYWRRTQAFNKLWDQVSYLIEIHNDDDGPRVARQMCDSIEHCGNPYSEGREAKARRCGGCKSAAYCSATCQRVDWEARHRLECDSLRQFTVSLPVVGSEFPMRAGAHLAAFVERICNKHSKSFEKHARRSVRTPVTSLVLRVDATSTPCLGGVLTIAEFFQTIRRSFADTVPRQQRIHSLLTQMLKVSQAHIAYAVFPLGPSTFHMLVRLWKEPGHPLRAMNFMTIGVSRLVQEIVSWTTP